MATAEPRPTKHQRSSRIQNRRSAPEKRSHRLGGCSCISESKRLGDGVRSGRSAPLDPVKISCLGVPR